MAVHYSIQAEVVNLRSDIPILSNTTITEDTL